MSGDPYEQRFLENLARVLGPLSEENSRGAHGLWWLRGNFNGQVVRVGLYTRDRGLQAMTLATSVGELPIRLLVNGRSRNKILATPEVRTGDPGFDEPFLVNGFPDEVVRAVLDAPTRHWFVTRFPEHDVKLSTERGWLHLAKSLRFGDVWGATSHEMSEEELADLVSTMVRFAGTLVASYHERRAELVRTGGESAAQSWEAHQRSLHGRVATAQRNLRIAVLGGMGCLILLVIAVIIGPVLFRLVF